MLLHGEVHPKERLGGESHGASFEMTEKSVVVASSETDPVTIVAETYTRDDTEPPIGFDQINDFWARLQDAERSHLQIR